MRCSCACAASDEERSALSSRARIVVLLAGLVIFGCANRPPFAQFTLVTTRAAFASATVIAPDVEGYYCFWTTILDTLTRMPWNLQPANHALALQAVMRQYPEANLMLNASFRRQENFFLVASRYCIFVKGDLARVE